MLFRSTRKQNNREKNLRSLPLRNFIVYRAEKQRRNFFSLAAKVLNFLCEKSQQNQKRQRHKRNFERKKIRAFYESQIVSARFLLSAGPCAIY
jgi:hypothetical protein